MAVAPEADTSAPPRIQEARKLSKTDALKAEAIYKEILSKKPGATTASLQEYEAALMGLGESYRDTGKTNELAELVTSSTSNLSSFTKAKTAKLGTLSPLYPQPLPTDALQFASSSTSFLPTPKQPPSRSAPQNHA